MTPQEMAEKIKKKFEDEFIGNWDLGIDDPDTQKSFKRKCAIFCCEEVINETKLHDKSIYDHARSGFWKEVKQILEDEISL